jgi:hypothetical protein
MYMQLLVNGVRPVEALDIDVEELGAGAGSSASTVVGAGRLRREEMYTPQENKAHLTEMSSIRAEEEAEKRAKETAARKIREAKQLAALDAEREAREERERNGSMHQDAMMSAHHAQNAVYRDPLGPYHVGSVAQVAEQRRLREAAGGGGGGPGGGLDAQLAAAGIPRQMARGRRGGRGGGARDAANMLGPEGDAMLD